MKKEYIRATHRFDNLTREWIYRGNLGEDMYNRWETDEAREEDQNHLQGIKYSLGVHGLRRDMWMDVDWLIDETIDALEKDANSNMYEFIEWKKQTPNHREIIREDLLKDLEYLVKKGCVMEKVIL